MLCASIHPTQKHPHSATHPPSMGLPDPLNTRPSWSRDTGVFNVCAGVGGGATGELDGGPSHLTLGLRAVYPGTDGNQGKAYRTGIGDRVDATYALKRRTSMPRTKHIAHPAWACPALPVVSSSAWLPPPPLGHPPPALAHLARELQRRLAVVDARRALEHLHHRPVAVHLQHLAPPGRAVAQLDIHDLGVPRLLRGGGGGGSSGSRGLASKFLHRESDPPSTLVAASGERQLALLLPPPPHPP